MRTPAKLLLLTLLFFLQVQLISAQSDVVAGFQTTSLKLRPDERTFKLDVVIESGGSRVSAGEFNVTYPLQYVSLTGVERKDGWTVIYTKGRFAFYTISSSKDKTIVATLHFALKGAGNSFEILLDYLKAADKNGNDLRVTLNQNEVKVEVAGSAPTPETSLPSGTITPPPEKLSPLPPERGSSTTTTIIRRIRINNWILVLAVFVASVLILLALYMRVRAVPAYYLMDESGRVIFKGVERDRVYGREDFTGILPPSSLSYISRRSKGGQFRTFVRDNRYYIVDDYSSNSTVVNGTAIRGLGQVELSDGSIISLPGVFQLTFRRGK